MIFQNVGLILVVIIVLIVVVILIMLGINAILFKLALRLVKAERTDLVNVYITSLICALLGWIPCVGCILCWVVINARHNIGLVKAILVWILAPLIALIIAISVGIAIIVLIFGVNLF